MLRTSLSVSLFLLAASLAAAPAAQAGEAPSKRTPAERDAARTREAENDAIERTIKDAWTQAQGGTRAPAAPKAAASPGKVADSSDRRRTFHGAGAGRFEGELRDLRVEAGPQGVHVEPLEQGLPRADQGFTFRLAGVRAGSTVLVGAGAQDAPVREQRDTLRYVRSGGVVERYELRGDGVEQTFTLTDASGLVGGADLVIEGAIETTLASDSAVRPDAHAPITLSDAGRPVLSYGAAYAIDAAGRRLDLPTDLSGSALTIVVDGAWLAQATFPVTVDPLIGTFLTVALGAKNEWSCDVAYSATSDVYLVVWELEYSTTDHDIWGILYDGAGAPASGAFAIEESTDDSLRPSCAWSPNGDRFLVAWEDDANLFGAYDIRGSIVNLGASPAVYGPPFEVYASASNHGLAHVGAQDSATGGFLVAWTLDFVFASQDYDSAAQRVSAAGAPVGGIIDVDASSLYNSYDSTVNKLGRGATPWLVACVDDRAVAGDLDVFVRSVSSGGSLGTAFDVAFMTDAEFSPSVAGDGSEFAIAYVRDFGSATGATDRDVNVQLASASARTGPSYAAALSLSHEDRPSIARWESSGATPAEYLVAWRDRATTPSSIEADRLTLALAQVENDIAVSTGWEDNRPSVAARRGAARQEWLVAWERTFSGPPTNTDIRAQRVQDVPPPVPVADFSAAVRNGTAPLSITFADLTSGNPTTWAWDFQNDGTVDATTQNPTFSYATAGSYSVKLTVTAAGGTDSETKTGYIVVTAPPPAPVADFSAAVRNGTAPLSITFADLTSGNPTTWAWDFQNDGTVDATTQNPTFSYSVAGSYSVKLTVTAPGGTDSETKVAYIVVTTTPPTTAPVADFAASNFAGGAPLTVTFVDTSTGGAPASWAWDFQDDGTTYSTLQSPQFTYTAAGVYSVRLTVTNAAGSSTHVEAGLVVVSQSGGAAPVADFDTALPTGIAPFAVAFTDRSTGTISTWMWSFGDGVTSNLQHPSHTFANPGVYTVFLTVSGPGGIDTKIRQNYVTVSAPQGGTTGGGTTGGGSTQGGVGSIQGKNGGGGGGGCAISTTGEGNAAGSLLPLLALIAALVLARRRA